MTGTESENGWGQEDMAEGTGAFAVNKFGGTSVASASAMTLVRDIVFGEMAKAGGAARMAVVVSAMGGKPKVTDLLLSTVTKAAAGDLTAAAAVLDVIYDKHARCLQELDISEAERVRLLAVLAGDMKDIRDLLRAVSLMRHENERMTELVSGYGETWSSQMMCALLDNGAASAAALATPASSSADGSARRFHYLDARRVLVVEEPQDGGGGGPEVCWAVSQANVSALLEEMDAGANLVVTGFVASTAEGAATTLKRDGSDYSATIFGRLLKAAEVTIWTDVDGVLSADPRKVPEAKVLAEVSFSEAMELAYFGAKVLHPKTMLPAVVAGIPVHIRNTFNPAFPGTRIFKSSTATKDRSRCVCGFSAVDGIALLNIEGSGMIGVPGVARRLFGALQEMGVSVILISQASSEHSISVAVRADQAEGAAAGVREAFSTELSRGLVSSVDVLSPCCIVAAVGDGMSKTTGVAGKFFSALGAARINILAIAQGCSERNISCVVSEAESARALRCVHAAFLLSHQTVSVGVVGAGAAGAAFLDLLAAQRDLFRQRYNCDLRVRAVADVWGRMLLSDDGIDLASWREKLRDCGAPLDMARLETEVTPAHLPHAVMIDFGEAHTAAAADGQGATTAAAAAAAAASHCSWLRRGMHVVSNNAAANGGVLAAYKELLAARYAAPGSYQYGATAGGAGLPIVSTLQRLQSTGDDVYTVEAVVSAGLSCIYNRISPAASGANVSGDASSFSAGFAAGEECGSCGGNGDDDASKPPAFSQALREAIAVGLLEPAELRQQLSGEVARRRALILGRELGLEMSAHDVTTLPVLLPNEMAAVDCLLAIPSNTAGSDEAWAAAAAAGLAAADERLRREAAAAAANGHVLRHSCTVDAEQGRASAGVRAVPAWHDFGRLRGASCCVRYASAGAAAPLVLRGPGGGTAAVARAVFADLLRVARDVGARDRGYRRSASFT